MRGLTFLFALPMLPSAKLKVPVRGSHRLSRKAWQQASEPVCTRVWVTWCRHYLLYCLVTTRTITLVPVLLAVSFTPCSLLTVSFHFYVEITLFKLFIVRAGLFKARLRGEKLNYNSCTSLLLRKSQNLLFLDSWSPVSTESLPCLFNSRSFKCFEPCPSLVCHVTTIENV